MSVEEQPWFDGYIDVEVTEWWCPVQEKWSWCPGPCSTGEEHTEQRTRTKVSASIKIGMHKEYLAYRRRDRT